MSSDNRRIAFVVDSITGEELVAGMRDSAGMFHVLTGNLGLCPPKLSTLLQRCSKAQFLEKLGQTLKNWNPADQLILYFTGHGRIVHSKYCLQFGVDNPEDLAFDNVLNELEIAGVLRDPDPRHVPQWPSSQGSCAPLPKELPLGIALLASCRANELSYEWREQVESVFTLLLKEGIETGLGNKPTPDGYISVSDILNYTNERLRDEQYKGYPQTPLLNVNEANRDIWIAKNKTGPSAPVSAPTLISPPIPAEELRLLYDRIQWSRHPCEHAELDELEWELVREFAERYEPELRQSSQDQLPSKLGLFSPITHGAKRNLHKAAILCFGRHPEKFIDSARAVFVSGKRSSPRFFRQDVTGPLSHQVSSLVKLAMTHLDKLSEIGVGEGGRRREAPEIPEEVVRELISNAIAHRDYTSSETVQVEIGAEHLMVQSPGSFPSDRSWDLCISTKPPLPSHPVDQTLAHYLTRLLQFEGIARGFMVFQEYVEANGPDCMTCQALPGPTTRILVRRPQLLGGQRIQAKRPQLPGGQTNSRNGLVLVADQVKDPWHWSWRLKDDRGTLLAHHEVALDPADWRAQAFTDLYRYVRQHADPGRWTQSTTELLGQVGAWAGEHVLGKVGPAIVKQGTPVTVRVELPADQALAEGLQYLPLELAHVDGKPLALQDVSLVVEVRPAGATPRDKDPTVKRLRMLAVFSLPTGAGPEPATGAVHPQGDDPLDRPHRGTGHRPARAPVWRDARGPQDDPRGE